MARVNKNKGGSKTARRQELRRTLGKPSVDVRSMLRQPEFVANPQQASRVVEVLEHSFLSLLDSLDVDQEVKVFIGEENLIEQFQSVSMLITSYTIGDRRGFMGLLGPMRMRYSYNKAVLEQARDFLEKGTV